VAARTAVVDRAAGRGETFPLGAGPWLVFRRVGLPAIALPRCLRELPWLGDLGGVAEVVLRVSVTDLSVLGLASDFFCATVAVVALAFDG
jgi:hypothetical protein